MEDFKKKYYEQSIHWDKNYSEIPREKDRIEQVISIIPPDTRTVLDVGCGNGFFVNTLARAFADSFDRVVGVDSAEEALKRVETEKANASIVMLPYEDESFDLVTCLEVLEHLVRQDFERGVSELERVAKKYLIITVPNNQNLASSLVMCPKCYCSFNPYYHLRSFDKNILHNLFEKFKLIEAREIGPTVVERSYGPLLLALYRSWRSWKKPTPPKTSICPQCGYQHKGELRNLKNNKSCMRLFSVAVSLFKPLVKIFSPIKRKTRWLLALYEKTDG